MRLYFTEHAKQRMSLRVISELEVLESLATGEYIDNDVDKDKYEVSYNTTRVVFQLTVDNLIIITVMHTKEFQNKIRRTSRNTKISKKEATKKLKNVI